MSLPIFVIHKGNSIHLKYCLHQAKHFNPNSEIILIGNRSNNKYRFIRHYHISGYSFNANIFAKNYGKLYDDPASRNMKNWLMKWFILRDFIEKHQHGEEFVYIDSNVLLYCDITKEFEKFKNYNITIESDKSMSCSFFRANKPLEDICNFITNYYAIPDGLKMISDKNERPKQEDREGMKDIRTFIANFKKQHPDQIGDNSVILDETTFEGNLCEAGEFEFDSQSNLKKIYWKDQYPFGKHLSDGNIIKFNALHFKAPAKHVMHRYYTGKGLRLQKAYSEVYNTINSLFR